MKLLRALPHKFSGFFGLLLPIERIVLLFGGFSLTLYTYSGLHLRRPIALYGLRLLECGELLLLLLLFEFLLERLRAVIQRQQPRPVVIHCKEFCRRKVFSPELWKRIRILHAVALTFVIFLQLKHIIPFLNPELFDSKILRLEQTWFGSGLLTEKLIRLFGTQSAPFWSTIYVLFYPYMAGSWLLFLLLSQGKSLDRFAARFSLLWFLGVLLVYPFPTLGPCFAYPEIGRILPETDVTKIQTILWQQRDFVLSHPLSLEGLQLIAGFPSLHIAVPFLVACESRRLYKPLFLPHLFFTIFTGISTLYLGWHYFLDLLGGLFLVTFVLLFDRALTRE